MSGYKHFNESSSRSLIDPVNPRDPFIMIKNDMVNMNNIYNISVNELTLTVLVYVFGYVDVSITGSLTKFTCTTTPYLTYKFDTKDQLYAFLNEFKTKRQFYYK